MLKSLRGAGGGCCSLYIMALTLPCFLLNRFSVLGGENKAKVRFAITSNLMQIDFLDTEHSILKTIMLDV